MEDENRRDKDEGEARLELNGDRPVLTIEPASGQVLSKTMEYGRIQWGRSLSGPCYVLCFSGPAVDIKYLGQKYGRHIVRINKPDLLVNDIASYLEQYANLPYGKRLDCVQVRYNKDLPAPSEPTDEEKEVLSYGQKAPKDSNDHEYRIVLMLPFTGYDPPEMINVQLHKKLQYAEIL